MTWDESKAAQREVLIERGLTERMPLEERTQLIELNQQLQEHLGPSDADDLYIVFRTILLLITSKCAEPATIDTYSPLERPGWCTKEEIREALADLVQRGLLDVKDRRYTLTADGQVCMNVWMERTP